MFKIDKALVPPVFDSWVKNSSDFGEPLRKYMLDEEQQHLCCYCEKAVTEHHDHSHIEHIRPRHKFPNLTFQYDNLAVSCQTNGRCGNGKGSQFGENFIVPTEEDPEKHLTYSPNGEVRPLGNWGKGQETIDILNLNAPALIGARKTLFKQLSSMMNEIEFKDFEIYFNEYPTFLKYFKENFL